MTPDATCTLHLVRRARNTTCARLGCASRPDSSRLATYGFPALSTDGALWIVGRNVVADFFQVAFGLVRELCAHLALRSFASWAYFRSSRSKTSLDGFNLPARALLRPLSISPRSFSR